MELRPEEEEEAGDASLRSITAELVVKKERCRLVEAQWAGLCSERKELHGDILALQKRQKEAVKAMEEATSAKYWENKNIKNKKRARLPSPNDDQAAVAAAATAAAAARRRRVLVAVSPLAIYDDDPPLLEKAAATASLALVWRDASEVPTWLRPGAQVELEAQRTMWVVDADCDAALFRDGGEYGPAVVKARLDELRRDSSCYFRDGEPVGHISDGMWHVASENLKITSLLLSPSRPTLNSDGYVESSSSSVVAVERAQIKRVLCAEGYDAYFAGPDWCLERALRDARDDGDCSNIYELMPGTYEGACLCGEVNFDCLLSPGAAPPRKLDTSCIEVGPGKKVVVRSLFNKKDSVELVPDDDELFSVAGELTLEGLTVRSKAARLGDDTSPIIDVLNKGTLVLLEVDIAASDSQGHHWQLPIPLLFEFCVGVDFFFPMSFAPGWSTNFEKLRIISRRFWNVLHFLELIEWSLAAACLIGHCSAVRLGKGATLRASDTAFRGSAIEPAIAVSNRAAELTLKGCLVTGSGTDLHESERGHHSAVEISRGQQNGSKGCTEPTRLKIQITETEMTQNAGFPVAVRTRTEATRGFPPALPQDWPGRDDFDAHFQDSAKERRRFYRSRDPFFRDAPWWLPLFAPSKTAAVFQANNFHSNAPGLPGSDFLAEQKSGALALNAAPDNRVDGAVSDEGERASSFF